MGDELRIVSVDEVPWEDVERVFGTRGDPATCWCQFFKRPGGDWNADVDGCRTDLAHQVAESDPPPGVIAYLGDEAVGWCAVEPRTNYSRLLASRVVEGSDEPLDDASVWAVTCFVVRVGYRRRGVGAALLAGARDQAARLGARVIEGYPMDVAEIAGSGRRVSSADLYHGTLSQFLAAGFEVVSRPSPRRAVVHIAVGE